MDNSSQYRQGGGGSRAAAPNRVRQPPTRAQRAAGEERMGRRRSGKVAQIGDGGFGVRISKKPSTESSPSPNKRRVLNRGRRKPSLPLVSSSENKPVLSGATKKIRVGDGEAEGSRPTFANHSELGSAKAAKETRDIAVEQNLDQGVCEVDSGSSSGDEEKKPPQLPRKARSRLECVEEEEAAVHKEEEEEEEEDVLSVISETHQIADGLPTQMVRHPMQRIRKGNTQAMIAGFEGPHGSSTSAKTPTQQRLTSSSSIFSQPKSKKALSMKRKTPDKKERQLSMNQPAALGDEDWRNPFSNCKTKTEMALSYSRMAQTSDDPSQDFMASPLTKIPKKNSPSRLDTLFDSPSAKRQQQPKRQAVPPKDERSLDNIGLQGVLFGKYRQDGNLHHGTDSGSGSRDSKLRLILKYKEPCLEIKGLREDEAETMKMEWQSIESIGVISDSKSNWSVLLIEPKGTMESIFDVGVFDPASSNKKLKQIFLILREMTCDAYALTISRLKGAFSPHVKYVTLNTSDYQEQIRDLIKLPSINLLSDTDEEDVALARRVVVPETSRASTTDKLTNFWSSLDTVGSSRSSNQPPPLPVANRTRTKFNWDSPSFLRNSRRATGVVSSVLSPSKSYGLRNGPRKSLVELPSAISDDEYEEESEEDTETLAIQNSIATTVHSMNFSYPPIGTKTILVEGSDIRRLFNGEFLNDTIIEFYIRFISERLREEQPELHSRCFFFNSFFFKKLSQKANNGNGGIGRPSMGGHVELDNLHRETIYSRLKKWTANVDLFDMDYIFVPINENLHWYLAIISNPRLLLVDGKMKDESSSLSSPSSQQKHLLPSPIKGRRLGDTTDKFFSDGNNHYIGGEDDETSADVEMQNVTPIKDSGNGDSAEKIRDVYIDLSSPKDKNVHVKFKGKNVNIPRSKYVDPDTTASIIILDSLGRGHQSTFKLLRGYMESEAKARHKQEMPTDSLVGKYGKVPLQSNFCDCGVFLLQYISEFLKDPQAFMSMALNGQSMRRWFDSRFVREKRGEMLKLTIGLAGKQKETVVKEEEIKPKIEEEMEEEMVDDDDDDDVVASEENYSTPQLQENESTQEAVPFGIEPPKVSEEGSGGV